MTWEITIQLVVGAAQLLVAVGTLLKLIQTHNTFNSKMDQALETAKAGAKAQGRLDEKDEQRMREGDAALLAESKKSS